MSMSDEELKRWQEIQSKYEYPVDPYGERISEDDQEKYTLWEDLGLYAYLKN